MQPIWKIDIKSLNTRLSFTDVAVCVWVRSNVFDHCEQKWEQITRLSFQLPTLHFLEKNGPPPHQLYLAFHSVSVFYPPHCSISLTTIAICRWSISLVLIQNNGNKPLATASPPHVHRYTQLNPAYTQLRSFVEFRCKMFYKKRRNAFSTKILSFLYMKTLHYTRVPCVSAHCSCCLLSCHSRWMFSFARFLSLSYVVQTGNVLHRFHTYSRRLGCHPFSVNALSRVHKPTTTSAPL